VDSISAIEPTGTTGVRVHRWLSNTLRESPFLGLALLRDWLLVGLSVGYALWFFANGAATLAVMLGYVIGAVVGVGIVHAMGGFRRR